MWTAFDHGGNGNLSSSFAACAAVVGADGARLTALSIYVQQWVAFSGPNAPAAVRASVWTQSPSDASPTAVAGYSVVIPAATLPTLISGYFTTNTAAPPPVDLAPGTRVSIGFSSMPGSQPLAAFSQGIAASVRL